jgi:glycosyltransferase involved in cell wall biosynthesis
MLEAMATGLPIIATTHGGIPEAVTSGTDGLLVPEHSPAELAQAILQILNHPDLRHQLGTNAAATVRTNFGAQAQITRLEDHYLEAIAKAQPPPSSAP